MLKFSVLVLFSFLYFEQEAIASSRKCNFTKEKISGVSTIEFSEESIKINGEMEIPLEKTKIKCGISGKRLRFDGLALGYQVVLETCTTQATLEGHLIDSVNQEIAELACE